MVTIQSLREAAVKAAYESAADRMPGVTLQQFELAVLGAEVHPVVVRGCVAGAVVVSGNEIHACVIPQVRGLWFKRRLMKVLDDVVRKYGCAVTSATTADGVRFVRRLGFVPSGDRWVKYGH